MPDLEVCRPVPSLLHTALASLNGIAGGHSIEPLILVRHTIIMVALERQHGISLQAGGHSKIACCLR